MHFTGELCAEKCGENVCVSLNYGCCARIKTGCNLSSFQKIKVRVGEDVRRDASIILFVNFIRVTVGFVIISAAAPLHCTAPPEEIAFCEKPATLARGR